MKKSLLDRDLSSAKDSIYITTLETDLGYYTCAILKSATKAPNRKNTISLCGLSFGKRTAFLVEDCRKRFPYAEIITVKNLTEKIQLKELSGAYKKIAHSINTYGKGKPLKSPLPIDLGKMTSFQLQVLKRTEKIPRGKFLSYQDLAKMIKNTNASRAVGSALGKNPVPLFIPCHRILASQGKLGGFSGGLNNKIKLLNLENIPHR